MKFDGLDDEYELGLVPYIGRCRLILINKSGHGIKKLKNHKWYEYSIQSDNCLPFGYGNLIMIPQIVTEEQRSDNKMPVIESGVSFDVTPLPHIDSKTGNIHSEDYNYDKLSGKPIQQIVCCGEGDPGPTIWNHLYNPVKYMDEYYKYKVNDRYGAKKEGDRTIVKQVPVEKERIFYVPKAAYYPLYETNNNRIKSIEFESKDNRELYEIMGTIWKQLGLDS